MTLQQKLLAQRAELEGHREPGTTAPNLVEQLRVATRELIASNAGMCALRVGDKAPAFTLNDTEGHPVSSSEWLARGPLVLSFYRGVWCAYCNLELQALQAMLPSLESLDATLVALSPQTAASSRKSIHQNGLTFPVLRDEQNTLAAAFGLRCKLPEYLIQLYKGLKVELPHFNGEESWTLPMPARYVIARDGRVLYARVSPDFTQRPEPEDLLPLLQEIRAESAAHAREGG